MSKIKRHITNKYRTLRNISSKIFNMNKITSWDFSSGTSMVDDLSSNSDFGLGYDLQDMSANFPSMDYAAKDIHDYETYSRGLDHYSLKGISRHQEGM